jgi:hypothetical protein
MASSLSLIDVTQPSSDVSAPAVLAEGSPRQEIHFDAFRLPMDEQSSSLSEEDARWIQNRNLSHVCVTTAPERTSEVSLVALDAKKKPLCT